MSEQIVLNKLVLKNFKGIKELSVDFSKVTNIYGENATGKTTIVDAFMWLLFDKDSKDRKDFEIKTIDKDGNVIHGLEHEVTGDLNVDGKTLVLSKIYKEKWTKKRGEAERNLTGHETLYYIDEVPVKKGEYQNRINNLIDESLFKLISNPLYFSTNMKWQDRRTVLLDIIGDITGDRVINYNSTLKPLEKLLSDKDIATLKKQIQARKKKLNDDIKAVPIRIDEASNSIKEIDFDALQFNKRGIVSGIKSIEEQLLDSSKVNDEILKQKDNLYELKSQLRDIEHKSSMEADKPKKELEKRKNHIENKIFKLNSELKDLCERRTFYENQIQQLKKHADELRNRWFSVNSNTLEFKENGFICPACKRPFEAEDIEIKKQEMTENFNQDKAKKLAEIQSKGKGAKENIEKLEQNIQDLNFKIEDLNNQLNDKTAERQDIEEKINNYVAKNPLLDNTEYQALKTEIEELEEKLQQPQEVNDKSTDLKNKKYQLQQDLENINSQLALKEQNIQLKDRIEELMEKEKQLAQQIASLEGQEFLCEEFIKTKVELLESSINSKFKYVSFKLFDTQVNGGLNETCEALINGVPFSNANTAAQINAGLDIINALSEYYRVEAPIFIDNRESINRIIDTESQIVNLVVSKDTKLKIESLESEVA